MRNAMESDKGMLAHKQLITCGTKKQARENLCTTQPLTKLVAILLLKKDLGADYQQSGLQEFFQSLQ